jgi:hypothetical protein
MKRLFYIAVATFAGLLYTSCNEDTDVFATQNDSLVKYLTSNRRLIAEEEIGSVIEDNPLFYSTFGRYTYRYIQNYYSEERNEWSTVEAGDLV